MVGVNSYRTLWCPSLIYKSARLVQGKIRSLFFFIRHSFRRFSFFTIFPLSVSGPLGSADTRPSFHTTFLAVYLKHYYFFVAKYWKAHDIVVFPWKKDFPRFNRHFDELFRHSSRHGNSCVYKWVIWLCFVGFRSFFSAKCYHRHVTPSIVEHCKHRHLAVKDTS